MDAANPHDEFFEFNVETIRLALQRDPYAYSQPFLDHRDDARIFETDDVAGGYRVTAFYTVDPDTRSVELRWLEISDN